jgi:flavin reductase (DIM6/NTAB) family NADH-FMN oxidoreductase RutF
MRKIWNRPNQTVWSLATTDQSGRGNMNICTYVCAVSMQPKLMMVALYHGTKTHENVLVTKKAILQLLSQAQASATRVCGHQSGKVIDKISRLRKSHTIGILNDIPFFTAGPGYLELELQSILTISGDHDLAIFSVKSQKNLLDVPLLTTDYMRAHGLLR